MNTRIPLARLATAAVLAMATTAIGMPAAHAARAAEPEDAFKVTLSSSAATTDFTHRTVDLTGTVTRADGAPVADVPVQLSQNVTFETWNPWGDPIDPTERESRGLGTLRTDAKGRFALSGVPADRWEKKDSKFPIASHEVEFRAAYDPGDPDDGHFFFADTSVTVQPVASTLSYKVDKTKVHPGDTLTVTGKVAWPAGHGPVKGARVLLRTYYETESNAQTTADANGNFTVRAKIRKDDHDFVLFSAPKDYYIAGATKELPVKNVPR
ncbi:acyl carrier protein [Streptomyces sp. NPDC050610]|uniref:acyl carrier protein n=1 Tax=Streptomyces sp. NPDC050610 TaxID=3157097 RepID=UPI00341A2946